MIDSSWPVTRWRPRTPCCLPRGALHGSKGVFGYLVPANSLTVVRVAR